MKYAYSDLGPQSAGATVVVHVEGGASNVLLLTMAEFLRYSGKGSFRYHGGRRRSSPMRLTIPSDDHWFAVLELATYNGRARATVEVVPPPGPAGPAGDRRPEHVGVMVEA